MVQTRGSGFIVYRFIKDNSIQFLVFAILAFSLPQSSPAQVLINEYSASNLNQFKDNYGEYHDWIELYNNGRHKADISGYFFSDEINNIKKWRIPDGTTIDAKSFLVFWASGRDEVKDGYYHTNFGLNQTKKKKDYIVFTKPSGIIKDSVQLRSTTQSGHSVGRYPDGGSWAIFTDPSPGVSNNTSKPFFRYASSPAANIRAGFFPSAIRVMLNTTEPHSSIRYTVDGTEPTDSSSLYTGTVQITATSVLKAVTFSSDLAILKSFTLFNTYFINEPHTIPVVSVSGTKLDLLAKINSSVIPVGSFEYFDVDGVRKAETYGDFNKHGQDSWSYSQKSIDFVARDQMGYNKYIREKLFATTERKQFQNVILRAAGDDNYPANHLAANKGSAHVRDAFVHGLADQGGLHLDVRRYAKCLVYINGQYWGVYDLRENPNKDDFCEYYYGQDRRHLYYLEYWEGRRLKYGGNAAAADWDTLHSFIVKNDMSVAANYNYVTERLDMTSLTDYILVNMFTVCTDWLNWNVGWWRGTDPKGGHQKWGFICWDEDAVFGHYLNYTGVPNTTPYALPCDPEGLSGKSDPEGIIQILQRLRQNPAFEQYYISRMLDLWNTVFSRDHMLHELDSMVAIIDPEMDRHANLWGGSYNEWKNNVDSLRNFIMRRCDALANGFARCYSLTGPYHLVFKSDPVSGGTIRLNSVVISQFPRTISYFKGVPIQLMAIPAEGYSFKSWSPGRQTLSPGENSGKVNFNLSGNDTIVVHFFETVDH